MCLESYRVDMVFSIVSSAQIWACRGVIKPRCHARNKMIRSTQAYSKDSKNDEHLCDHPYSVQKNLQSENVSGRTWTRIRAWLVADIQPLLCISWIDKEILKKHSTCFRMHFYAFRACLYVVFDQWILGSLPGLMYPGDSTVDANGRQAGEKYSRTSESPQGVHETTGQSLKPRWMKWIRDWLRFPNGLKRSETVKHFDWLTTPHTPGVPIKTVKHCDWLPNAQHTPGGRRLCATIILKM